MFEFIYKLKYVNETKQKSGEDNITTLNTSNESRLHWRNHFHENPLYFRRYADFEADNEKDNSSVGNKTIYIYTQNPVLKGYHINIII